MPARTMNQTMNHLLTCLAVAVLSMLASCRSVPYTGRTQLMLTPVSYEQKLGLSSYKEYKEENKLSANAEYNAAIKRCGDAIVSVAGQEDFEWEFVLFDSKTQNAFCLPGGKVAVYSGIMDLMQNEAELAFVLSHEIAHAIARHGGERMSWGYLKTAGGSLISAATGSSAAGTLFSKSTEYGVMLPFSRGNEYEADRIGMLLMAKAGYQPQAAIQFWARFTEGSEQSALDGMMSTHPRDEDRINAMKENLPEAEAAYAAAAVRRGSGASFSH